MKFCRTLIDLISIFIIMLAIIVNMGYGMTIIKLFIGDYFSFYSNYILMVLGELK